MDIKRKCAYNCDISNKKVKRHQDLDLLFDIDCILISLCSTKKYQDYNKIKDSEEIVDNILKYLNQFNLVLNTIRGISFDKDSFIWGQNRKTWLRIHEYIPLIFGYYNTTRQKIETHKISISEYFNVSIHTLSPVNVINKGIHLNKMKKIVDDFILFYKYSTDGEILLESEKNTINIITKYKRSLEEIIYFYRDVHTFLLDNKATKVYEKKEDILLEKNEERIVEMGIYFN